MKLSVVINTLNEEENLPSALESIKKLADEIVVVDMQSDDKTVEIAKRAGAKVYKHKKTGYVEPARNYAIEKASGDWVFVLDADETVPKSLVKKIKKIIEKPKADYYRIPRRNIIFGKWIKHTRWWPDFNIRLFKKGHVSWSEVIHSVPMTKGVGLDLKANKELAIKHYHYKSTSQYIRRLDRYTSLHAQLKKEEGYEFKWRDVIFKPAQEFISRYFEGQGYKDGLHGLVLSILQGFSEAALYIKVWELEGFSKKDLKVKKVIKEMKKAESEVHYWQADTLIKKGGGIKQRIKRKLKIA